jgi:hypothetical protein
MFRLGLKPSMTVLAKAISKKEKIEKPFCLCVYPRDRRITASVISEKTRKSPESLSRKIFNNK